MNWRVVGTVIIIIVLAGLAAKIFWPNRLEQPSLKTILMEKIQTIKIISPAFEDNKTMPAKYTCDGENINPPLEIGNVPAEAKSLALIMDDPDAPAGVWDHWVKFNIPPDTRLIEEGKEPAGVSGKGTRGNLSYKGPCPPSGTHRYFFKIYALEVLLDLPAGAGKTQLEQAMSGHIIGQGELIGLYSRQK